MTTDELEEAPGDNRPPAYIEDEVLRLRASAFGSSCLFELVAAGQGYEPGNLPANMMRAFQEGHDAEPIIVELLKSDYGVVFMSQQGEGELEVSPRTRIRYHSDGIVFIGSEFWFQVGRLRNIRGAILKDSELPPRHVVLEIKNLSHALWQNFVRNGMGNVIDEYEWQLSVMMHRTGKPGLWCGRNKGYPPDKETGIKPYCEDEGKLYFQLVLEPPIPLQDIIDKGLLIEEQVFGEDITDTERGCDDPTNFPCRYLYLRREPDPDTEEVEDRMPDLTEDQWQEFVALAREYVFVKGQKDELESRYDEAKARLFALFGLAAGDKITIRYGGWVVPIYTGTGQSSYDWAGMPETLKEELNKYKKPGKKYLYIRGAKRDG